MSPRTVAALGALFAGLQFAGVLPAASQTVAITGGTIYPVSGPKIEHGTVLLRDGVIVAVGADVPVPSGATRIEATGRWITPGFIASATTLGIKLFETSGELETQEDTVTGDVNAAVNVADAIDPASVTIPVARLQGITTAIATPSGGLVAGQAALFDLAGERLPDLLVRSPAAMVADLSQYSKQAGGGSRAGTLQRLRQLLRDAREYQRRKSDFEHARMQPLSAPAADLEALQPVLDGQLPLFVTANRRSDIENALRIAQEYGVHLVIRGGVEGWQMAAELAQARIPVVVEPLTDIPSFDAPDARLDNAALLNAAGVTVLIAQTDQAQFRDLRQAAGNAVRTGLPWDAALRAVTLGPAEAFGVGSKYGSLEAGKVADLVVWSGDPFEFSSRAEHVLIRGRDLPLVTRQTELLRRYRKLPPAY
jgi:imidazolonepropionase-like amidohydrolase